MSLKDAKVQKKNPTKMGKVWHISLPPVMTCEPGAPCREKGCYAMKAWHLYKLSREAWQHNLDLFVSYPGYYFASIATQLMKARKPEELLFRWHMSGDIPDFAYLEGMVHIARAFPKVRFLAFTKRYYTIATFLRTKAPSFPDNLTIILSAWPGMKMHNPYGLPVAWMQPEDGTETRIPETAIPCAGRCDKCTLCWGLQKTNRDVVFHYH